MYQFEEKNFKVLAKSKLQLSREREDNYSKLTVVCNLDWRRKNKIRSANERVRQWAERASDKTQQNRHQLVAASLLPVADLLQKLQRLVVRALVVGSLLLPVACTQQVLRTYEIRVLLMQENAGGHRLH